MFSIKSSITKICLLLMFFENIIWLVEGSQGKLIMAQVLYRHGDRTPIDPYPNDPWGNASYWETGWGQLTNLGKQQHYALGKWLRQRYSSILSEKYSKDNIYIHSTDVDRTLMSALSNLAGLYEPIPSQIWNENLLWQPIPVHTIPETFDYVLAAKRPCAAYDYALKKYKNSEEYRNMLKKYKPLMEYLTEHAGRKIDSFTGVNNLYNNLYIEYLKNFTLPNWTKKVFPDGDMKWISARSFATKTFTPELARLKTGFLLNDIFNRFLNKSHNKISSNLSMFVYSAHDTTVANVLNSLNMFEYHSPPYTACIMFELRMVENEAWVQIFYKNTTETPEPMMIKNCGLSCPLKKLFEIYRDILPTGSYEEECQMSMLAMTYQEAEMGSAMGLVVIGSVLLLLSLLCFAFISAYQKRHDDKWYLRIDSD